MAEIVLAVAGVAATVVILAATPDILSEANFPEGGGDDAAVIFFSVALSLWTLVIGRHDNRS